MEGDALDLLNGPVKVVLAPWNLSQLLWKPRDLIAALSVNTSLGIWKANQEGEHLG